MKKKLLYVAFLLSLLSLVNCVAIKWLIPSNESSPYYSGKRYDLFRLALNSFPGPRQGRGARIDEAHIEIDDYGRELFLIRIFQAGEYYQGDILNNGTEVDAAYVISQAHDDTKVYYYEDLCFKLFNERKGVEQDLLEELKVENDWNKPMQMEKCSSRLYEDDFAGMSSLTFNYDAQKSIDDAFDGENLFDIIPITEDATGKELYGVRIMKEDQDECYMVIYHPGKAIDKENGVLKLKDIDFGKDLHVLKLRNNWDFTNCPGTQGDNTAGTVLAVDEIGADLSNWTTQKNRPPVF